MRILIAASAAVAAALGLAACGSGTTTADVDNGKSVFATSCGSCHALSDAGTKGIAAVEGVPVPNLDDAFRGARQDGWKDSQFEGVVARWIRLAAPPMPRDLVTGQDARDVAAYLASVAGKNQESAVSKLTPLPPLVEPGGLAPGEGGETETP
ncbi:MAG: cytochrome c [Actinomycetota bacterium]